jgi:hypothetical protein
MLSTTQDLIAMYERGDAGWQELDARASIILRHGSRADAEAVLAVFLTAPERGSTLVPILAEHGDASLAQRLEAACLSEGSLREGVPDEVLHCLGYLGSEPAQGMLWEHARASKDWYQQRSACLGLLHLSCRGLETDITRELARYEGQNVFPEFLPALAFKTGEPTWLKRLVAWGEHAASTDCNGGLILGIALDGAAGRPHFEQLLWSERWEAHGGGTGSERWTYAGTRILGIALRELYEALRKQLAEPTSRRSPLQALRVFLALLDSWLRRPWLGLRGAREPTESPAELHALLFRWTTPDRDDSIKGLARELLQAEKRLGSELHRLEQEILLQMKPGTP